jgi:hypothetical protein
MAIRAWLIVSILVLALAGYEDAAERGVWGLHTISELSFLHQWLGWVITAAMLSVVAWWVHHFHSPHPR